MNLITDFLTGILRIVIKLVFLVLTAVFVLAVLAIGITVALLTVIWALLSGRRPALVTNFTRFRQAAQPFGPKAWTRPAAPPKPQDTEVVDVQAREVPAALDADGQPERPEPSRK